MKLAILAVEGCMHSAIAGVGDILSLANHVMQQSGAKPRFSWQTLSLDGKPVRAGGGQMVPVDGAIGQRARFDAILVPGNLVDHVTAARLQPQYARAGAWLRQQYANGRLIGAFCSGVFLLAGAGLLDHRRATITWWLQSELRQRHPSIDLAADAVVTVADRIVCAAGPMSWVDLLLRLIELVEGKEIAKLCADYVVIDTAQRTQSIFMPIGYLLSQDPLLTRADLLVRRTGKAPMTVKRLAGALGLSERTMNRKFQETHARAAAGLHHTPPRRARPHAAGDDDAADQGDRAHDRL